MKKFITIIGLVALTMSVSAQPRNIPVSGFGVGSTNPATALSYAIVSARAPQQGMAPAVSYINAGSDLASSKIQFYRVTTNCVAKFATNSTTTLSVNQTNGFASGDVIIIRHLASDTYEKRILTTMTGSTNLVTTVAPLAAVWPNDIIYKAVTTGAGVIPVGATTNSWSGTYVYVGQSDTPLLVEIDGTSAGQISVVGGRYIQ